MFSSEQIDELNKKLCPDVIKERRQGNAKLSYIEGHHAIRRANEIFRFDGWTRQTVKMEKVVEEEYTSKRGQVGTLVAYIAQVQVRVRVGEEWGEWIETDGYGYGEGIDYNNPGQAHEGAVKEAETDAMKRALIKFGDQFGLALYDKERKNVGRDESPEDEDGGANTKSVNKQQLAKIFAMVKERNIAPKEAKELIYGRYSVSSSKDMTSAQASDFIDWLEGEK